MHKLYVSDEHGGTDTVIDTASNKRIATIPLGGEVGNTQYDPASRHIFANAQTRGQLAEIDPATDKVVRRIDLPGAAGNHGLYIDSPARLAFVACEGNDKLLVLGLASQKIIGSFDAAKDPDVLAFDYSLGWRRRRVRTGFCIQGARENGQPPRHRLVRPQRARGGGGLGHARSLLSAETCARQADAPDYTAEHGNVSSVCA